MFTIFISWELKSFKVQIIDVSSFHLKKTTKIKRTKKHFICEKNVLDVCRNLFAKIVQFKRFFVDISKMSSEISSSDEEPTPAKRRRFYTSENISFKEKVQNVLDQLTYVAPGEFAVSGKLEAPLIAISIKVRSISFP